MDKKIKKMVLGDRLVLILLMILLWIILIFAALVVASICTTESWRMLVLLSAATVALFSSLTLMAVLVHLKKNRAKLYNEEMKNCSI